MENDGSLNDHAMLVLKYVRPDRGGVLRRDDARNLLRRTLEYYTRTGRLRLYAWAFLPSRVALLVAMPTPRPLEDAVGDAFGYYTRRLNNRYHRTGPVFRTRFVKKLCTGPEEILRMIAKVHVMPHMKELTVRPGAEALSSEDVYLKGAADAITTRYVLPSSSRITQIAV